MVSRSPSVPTRTGKLPTFTHELASPLRFSGGSNKERNLPLFAVKIVCADSNEHSMLVPRLEGPAEGELSFDTSTFSFHKRSLTCLDAADTLPEISSCVRTKLPITRPHRSHSESVQVLPEKLNSKSCESTPTSTSNSADRSTPSSQLSIN